jgi:3-keto-5-aminohexanoate cleavage enzyme
MDVAAFRAAFDAIREASDLVVQFTSGGAVSDPEEARIAPLELRPPMASLTTGTTNFGPDVFWNPEPLVARFYKRMRELGIVPEFEIFEAGMIANAERLLRRHGDDHHRHFDFVLGVPGAMPAWEDSVAFLAAHLPEGATWSATGIGKSFEVEPGVLAASNAQLVERVVALASAAGRDVATPVTAREILGLAP